MSPSTRTPPRYASHGNHPVEGKEGHENTEDTEGAEGRKFWQLALMVVLVYWGLLELAVFHNSDVLSIGAFITAALILFDR
jgi:hypothetical protein